MKAAAKSSMDGDARKYSEKAAVTYIRRTGISYSSGGEDGVKLAIIIYGDISADNEK